MLEAGDDAWGSPATSPSSTPMLPPQFARAVTVDEARFQRAKYRKLQGMSRGPEVSEYTFVQLADTQLGMLPDIKTLQWLRGLRALIRAATCGLKDGRRTVPIPLLLPENDDMDADALLELEIELSTKAVLAINSLRPKPRFAVVCGDLVHAYPDKQPEINAAQVKMFKEVFSRVDPEITLVCTCGNHDIGDRPTPGSLLQWHKRFGDDYFSFWVGTDRFLVLNTQLYKDGSQCMQEAKAQDRWLDHQLFEAEREEPFRHTVVFSHIPPFIDDPEEPSGYFPLAKPVRLNLLKRMVQGGVGYWFCGHFHRNAGGRFKNLEVVTTAAVGGNLITDKKGDRLGLSGMGEIVGAEELSGLRICTVTPSGVRHEFRTLAELVQPTASQERRRRTRARSRGSFSSVTSLTSTSSSRPAPAPSPLLMQLKPLKK